MGFQEQEHHGLELPCPKAAYKTITTDEQQYEQIIQDIKSLYDGHGKPGKCCDH